MPKLHRYRFTEPQSGGPTPMPLAEEGLAEPTNQAAPLQMRKRPFWQRCLIATLKLAFGIILIQAMLLISGLPPLF